MVTRLIPKYMARQASGAALRADLPERQLDLLTQD